MKGGGFALPCWCAPVQCPATVSAVATVAVVTAKVGAVAVVRCTSAAGHPPPGGLTAMAPHAAMEVVVVVVPVPSRVVPPASAVVVSLSTTPLSQGVRCPVVPEELAARLPVGWVVVSAAAAVEGEVF